MSIILRDATNPSYQAQVDSNQNLHIAESTLDATVGTPGAAVPASAMQVAGSDGVDSRVLATDATGQQKILVKNAVSLNGLRAALGTFSVQSTSASPTPLITAGTGYNDIVSLVLTNESASTTIVSITDGTVVYKFALGGNAGLNINFVSTLPETTSAVGWTISNSAAVNVDCSGVYVKD